MTPRQSLFVCGLLFCALAFLSFYNLGGTGVLDPDEPRYAAIGRAMAETGDYVTPRLWGDPWFEKPALLYWMTAAGTLCHLNPDLAGRLPVTLLSVLFLAVWFWLLHLEFGATAAAIATVLLGSCAAWVTYSSLCLTDVPLSVFFSLAVAAALRILRGDDKAPMWLGLGAALGFACLAKGLVPVVLSVPLAWFLRDKWRQWIWALAAFLVVAAPWYALVLARNGWAFVRVFFLEQQFSRLYSHSLQHIQPVWFYIPVLLLLLFPWSPLLICLRSRDWQTDRRLQCLFAVFLFGFVFFSVSRNKLPGYLLPLVPSLFAVLGAAAARRRAFEQRALLWSCAVLVALIPLVGQIIPTALTTRLTSVREVLLGMLPLTGSMLLLFVTPLFVAAFARRRIAGLLLILCCIVAAVELKRTIYPVLDQQVSPRGMWRQIASRSALICDAGLHRAWAYGFGFYRGKPFPACYAEPRPLHLVQQGARPPELRPETAQ